MSVIKPLLKKVYYFGFKHQCTICKSYIKTFLPHGLTHKVLTDYHVVGGMRTNVGKCPICRCTERERLLFNYLFSSGRIELKNTQVLHVAPEAVIARQFNAMREQYGVTYESGDKFTEGYDYADCKELDITKTSYPDNTFDLVLCNHVLEHIPDDRQAMLEIYRILKSGGKAILQVPISKKLSSTIEDPSVTDPREREIKFGQFDHIRIYGQDYILRLKSCGFSVSANEPAELFGVDVINKQGLNPEERLFIASKP